MKLLKKIALMIGLLVGMPQTIRAQEGAWWQNWKVLSLLGSAALAAAVGGYYYFYGRRKPPAPDESKYNEKIQKITEIEDQIRKLLIESKDLRDFISGETKEEPRKKVGDLAVLLGEYDEIVMKLPKNKRGEWEGIFSDLYDDLTESVGAFVRINYIDVLQKTGFFKSSSLSTPSSSSAPSLVTPEAVVGKADDLKALEKKEQQIRALLKPGSPLYRFISQQRTEITPELYNSIKQLVELLEEYKSMPGVEDRKWHMLLTSDLIDNLTEKTGPWANQNYVENLKALGFFEVKSTVRSSVGLKTKKLTLLTPSQESNSVKRHAHNTQVMLERYFDKPSSYPEIVERNGIVKDFTVYMKKTKSGTTGVEDKIFYLIISNDKGDADFATWSYGMGELYARTPGIIASATGQTFATIVRDK